MDELPYGKRTLLTALPGNGIMAMNLIKLSESARKRNMRKGRAIIRCAAEVMELILPQTLRCCALLYLEDGGTEIVLVNGRDFRSKDALPLFALYCCGCLRKGFEEIVSCPILRNTGKLTAGQAYVCRREAVAAL